MKMRFPGFKILDRYILGKFLTTYFFSIAMIIVIVVVFDYVEKIDDFTELHAPLKSVILDYYLNFIPYFIRFFHCFTSRIHNLNRLTRIIVIIRWYRQIQMVSFSISELQYISTTTRYIIRTFHSIMRHSP